MNQKQTNPNHTNNTWLHALKGKFIVFDGPDGSGKTTQYKRFAQLAKQNQIEVCQVREPGGTPIGEKIRDILLNPQHHQMNATCEMLLYMASRAQLAHQQLLPAKQRGALILADRFISSTLAYQGAAGGIPTQNIMQIGKLAVQNAWPDLVVIFDVSPQNAEKRISKTPDRIELKESNYHKKVRQSYLQQVQDQPQNHLLIDANQSVQAVYDALIVGLKQKFT